MDEKLQGSSLAEEIQVSMEIGDKLEGIDSQVSEGEDEVKTEPKIDSEDESEIHRVPEIVLEPASVAVSEGKRDESEMETIIADLKHQNQQMKYKLDQEIAINLDYNQKIRSLEKGASEQKKRFELEQNERRKFEKLSEDSLA